MLRALFLGCLFLFSSLVIAKQPASLYQIDMIVFTHLKSSSVSKEDDFMPVLAADMKHAIPLENTVSSMKTPYHTLPASASLLRDAYWTLNRKPQYQILFQSSWLQPGNNQSAVALSKMNAGSWNVEGTLRVRRSNYYLLDTQLLFSAPHSKQTAFVFSQKQRLKPGVTYYLDHPQAGMLIKIHQIT